MGKLKALDEKFNLANKRILLRVDLNVPLQDGKVTDESRIKKVVPIIKEFINKKAKVVLISHLGRPKGKIDKKLSLKPITTILENLLNTNDEQLVSSDFNHDPHSSIVDLSLTKVIDKKMAKVSAWYDNEWGFANRMCDLAVYLGNLK